MILSHERGHLSLGADRGENNASSWSQAIQWTSLAQALRWLAVSAPDAVEEPTTTPAEEDRTGDVPLRQDLIERVRRDIARGNYDTPEKWEQALDRLINDMERE